MKQKRIVRWSAGAIPLAVLVAAFIAYWTSDNDCDRYTAVPGNPMKAIVSCSPEK